MTADFIDEAASFALACRARWPFRYLRRFLRCSEDQLLTVMAKIYCDSLPQSGPAIGGLNLAVALLHPLHILTTKTILWRRLAPVVFDLETIDPPYFERWFSRVYRDLQGAKRLTPRHDPAGLPGPEVSDSVHGTITLRSALLIFIAPLCVPWLLQLVPAANRPRILKAFRHALSVYAQFDGHFRRYPCRHFITYSDETNHPARYLAFHQNCPGNLVVIQNGERYPNSMLAFGMMDLYLVFGEAMRGICARARVQVGRIVPVGSLALNEFHDLLTAKGGTAPEILSDVLFVDQGVYPHNGLSESNHQALERLLEHLAALKREDPTLRVAYQFRYYPPGSPHRQALVKWLESRFDREFDFLDNTTDRGESYLNIMRTNLVVTFASSLGFEALRMGRKALFVNFSGDPASTACADARFQIDDPSADFDSFSRRIHDLLRMRHDDIPQVALDRHVVFDGRVQERIAAVLNGFPAEPDGPGTA